MQGLQHQQQGLGNGEKMETTLLLQGLSLALCIREEGMKEWDTETGTLKVLRDFEIRG